MKKIEYKENFISRELVAEIKNFYDVIVNDDMSNSPRADAKLKNGLIGCWDRPLKLDLDGNPLTAVVDRLREEYGDFEIYESSIRYLAAPFGPHTDIRNHDWLVEQRKTHTPGFTFLIPLWWEENYRAGTAWFDSPAKEDQLLYGERLDLLPEHTESFKNLEKNFSVREIFEWQTPGDLIVWESFQWHCSLSPKGHVYNSTKWCKEFVSIETSFRK